MDCANYEKNWACPPLPFDAGEYLKTFPYVYIIAVKTAYDDDTVKSLKGQEANAFVWDIFQKMKNRLLELLYALELNYPGIGVSAGRCEVCERCSRLEGISCGYPDKMRHSFESFGFDMSKISEDLFSLPIKWATGGLPPYHTFVNAFFAKSADEAILQDIRAFEFRL